MSATKVDYHQFYKSTYTNDVRNHHKRTFHRKLSVETQHLLLESYRNEEPSMGIYCPTKTSEKNPKCRRMVLSWQDKILSRLNFYLRSWELKGSWVMSENCMRKELTLRIRFPPQKMASFWGPIYTSLLPRFIHPSIGGSLGILRVLNQPGVSPHILRKKCDKSGV